MKNLSIYTIFILLLAFALTSCRDSAGQAEDNVKSAVSVTVTFWHYYNGVQQTAFDNLVNEFNAGDGQEKGIIIEAVSYGGVDELSKAVFSSAKAETDSLPMPDLFNAYSDSAYKLAEMNKLADLRNYFTHDETLKYMESYINEGKFSGEELYGFPIAKATEVFMMNKTDWDKFAEAVNANTDFENISQDMLNSWEGILKASEIYHNWTDAQTEALNDGKALFGIDSAANFFYTGAAQLGYELINPSDGSVDFGENVRGTLRTLWNSYYVPMIKGYYGAYGRFRSDDVKTGDILCFVGSTSSAAYFPLQIAPEDGDNYDIEVYVAPYPSFEGKKKTAIQQGAGICMAKTDENRERAAAEFLKWLTEPDRNIEFVLNAAGYFPVTAEAMNKFGDMPSTGRFDEKTEKVLNDVLTHGSKQMKEYSLYNAPPFENSANLRTAFEALKMKAVEQRNLLLEKAEDSEAYTAFLEAAVGDEAFDEWVSSLSV